MNADDLKAEIDRALSISTLPLNHHGTCSMMTVATTTMKTEQIVDNIMKVGEVLAQKYPGNWKNIRSLHIKTEGSLSLPIHISLSKTFQIFQIEITQNV